MSLRVQGEQAAFDDLSIDYCVTYEVSPPPWEPLPGRFIVQASDVPFGDTVEAEVPVVNARLAGDAYPDRLIVSKDLMGKIADEIALIQRSPTNTTGSPSIACRCAGSTSPPPACCSTSSFSCRAVASMCTFCSLTTWSTR
ncbi:MAG: hypothetical protein R3E68_11700 [Burkholderiaceae bacterium]